MVLVGLPGNMTTLLNPLPMVLVGLPGNMTTWHKIDADGPCGATGKYDHFKNRCRWSLWGYREI